MDRRRTWRVYLSHERQPLQVFFPVSTACCWTRRRSSAAWRTWRADIERDFAGRELSVVTLMDGALFFVADLLRAIDLPVRLHTLTVSSYHGATESTGRVRLAQTLPFDLATRHVLLIDDILDTGLTLATVRERILRRVPPGNAPSGGAAEQTSPSRTGGAPWTMWASRSTDEFVVGYGMDYQGHYRNLPCIGILNPGLPRPTMTVRVLFFSVLRDVTGTGETDRRHTPDARVGHLLDDVFIRWPKLQRLGCEPARRRRPKLRETRRQPCTRVPRWRSCRRCRAGDR